MSDKMGDKESDFVSDDFVSDIGRLAAESTGTVGLPDDAAADGPLYESMASAIEAFDEHEALKGREPEEFVEEDEQPRGGKVPIGALQSERTKRQQLQLQLEAQAQELAQYQQQLAQFQQYQQQVAQGQQQQLQQEAIPDFDEDPRGYIEAKERLLAQKLQNVEYQQQYQHAVVQLSQECSQLAPSVVEAENALRAEVGADQYDQAYQMVHQTIQANMRQQHPNASPQEMALIEQTTNVEFIRTCKARNIDPALHIWNLAQQWGFTPGQRVPATRQIKAPPTSLSTLPAGGRAPDQQGKVRAADIANMPQEDFDKLWAAMKEGGTQRPAV